MRNGSLWSDVVFEKEVIFHEFDFETSYLEFEVSKSSIWKHTTSCDKDVFFFHSLLATFTTNWAQYVILCICWDTPSEKTGLWQLSIVSMSLMSRPLVLIYKASGTWISTSLKYSFVFAIPASICILWLRADILLVRVGVFGKFGFDLTLYRASYMDDSRMAHWTLIYLESMMHIFIISSDKAKLIN